MRIRTNIIYFLGVALAVVIGPNAQAFDLSGCVDNYAKEHNIKYDLEKPQTLIEPIVFCHSVVGDNSEEAQNAEDTISNIINNYALELYGEAVALRVSMLPKENNGAAKAGKGLAGLAGLILKDKKSIVQKKTAPSYKEILEHITKIIKLEAQIANLEGAKVIKEYKDPMALFTENKGD